MPTLDDISRAQSRVHLIATQFFVVDPLLLQGFELRAGAPLLARHTRGTLVVPPVLLMQLAAAHP
eukprot:4875362-Amphidinium_carterae.1